MPRGSPTPQDPLDVQWQNIYAGLGGWVGNTYYHPGYTPQGAVQYNPNNRSADPAPLLNPPSSTSSSSSSSSNVADLADPFRSQRAQYQTQLSDLVNDPTKFYDSGLFTSQQNAGLSAINRSAAAKGLLKSGNRLVDLMDYGRSKGAENYFQYANLLGTLSGATTGSPAAAASATVAENTRQDNLNSQATAEKSLEELKKKLETQQWNNNNSNVFSQWSMF